MLYWHQNGALCSLQLDDNHKPEMTIAVTPFDGLCGFRPIAEISHFLSSVPSLRKLVGDSEANKFETAVRGQDTAASEADVLKNKKALQAAFSALMKNDKGDVAAAAKDLVASAEKEGEQFAGEGGPSNGGKELADLVVRLNGQFEGDIGLFVLFFLNYVKLEVGEAMFLKADDIHAYLSGGIFYSSLSISAHLFPPLSLYFPLGLLMTDSELKQTSSSAWRPPTMSSAPASRPSSKTFRHLPAC